MKKLLIAMISVIMMLALTACGGGNGNSSNNGSNGESSSSAVSENPYNLDMKSTEAQPMSKERASAEVLRETFQTYLGGYNYFEGTEQANLTYNDVKGHIGVDASEYRYDDTQQAALYIWYVDGDDKASLNIWFIDGKINACGAMNIV